jgi:hypothetical protein
MNEVMITANIPFGDNGPDFAGWIDGIQGQVIQSGGCWDELQSDLGECSFSDFSEECQEDDCE